MARDAAFDEALDFLHRAMDGAETRENDLRGTEPDGMYEMLVKVVEKPLLEVVMDKADHNQSRAAEWLGLNRNTLRKKLVEHKLLKG